MHRLKQRQDTQKEDEGKQMNKDLHNGVVINK
jgi:hypothetical protein